jgi:hypothetical protein
MGTVYAGGSFDTITGCIRMIVPYMCTNNRKYSPRRSKALLPLLHFVSTPLLPAVSGELCDTLCCISAAADSSDTDFERRWRSSSRRRSAASSSSSSTSPSLPLSRSRLPSPSRCRRRWGSCCGRCCSCCCGCCRCCCSDGSHRGLPPFGLPPRGLLPFGLPPCGGRGSPAPRPAYARGDRLCRMQGGRDGRRRGLETQGQPQGTVQRDSFLLLPT